MVAEERAGGDRLGGLAAARAEFYEGTHRPDHSGPPRKNRGGLLSAEDLADFHIRIEEPTTLNYRGYDV